jgi:hypothetical protein
MNLTHSPFVIGRVERNVRLQDSMIVVSELDMRNFHSWRALLVIVGTFAAIAACTNTVPRQDSGGAPNDSSQPRPDRGGGGGSGY